MTETAITTMPNHKARTCEAGAFYKRIGSTTYRVGIHFSWSSKETAQDKIVRLVRMEAQDGGET